MHKSGFVPKRAEQMQFWRFIAFFHVFLQHTMNWNGFLHYPAFKSGLIAISFFFMLSGALSGYNAPCRCEKPSLKDVVRHGFRKAKGFYPVYLVMLVISLFARPLTQLLVTCDLPGLAKEMARLGLSALLLQSWSSSTYFDFTGVGWFFSTILMLYLTQLPFGYLLNRLNQHPRGRRRMTGILCMLGLITVLAQYLLTFTADAYYFKYIFPPARLGEYLIGMTVGFLVRTHEKEGSRKLFTALETFAAVLWVISIFLCPDNWMDIAVWWLVPNGLVLAVFLQGRGALSDLFRKTTFVSLGGCVMECVLIHGMILDFYTFVSPIAAMPGGRAGALSLALTFSATVLMARKLHGGRKA